MPTPEKYEFKIERNPLLEGPELTDTQEIEKEGEKGILSETFFSKNRRYQIGINEGTPFILIEYFDELPKELELEERQKFAKERRMIDEKERDVYVFRYGNIPESKILKKEEEYYISLPREKELKGKEVVPQKKELQEVVEILKGKRVLFYSGAGISTAAGLPQMEEIYQFQEKILGINFSKLIDDFLKRVLKNPEKIIEIWKEFQEKFSKSSPTPAHWALKDLALTMNAKIFTENYDNLHEKTGIKPIRPEVSYLKENLRPEWLKEIEIVVTLGLSHDDRGFLGWYKKCNPQGKILAIDLKPPPYLDEEDIFLEGDLQKLVPELTKKIKTAK
jgi:NAD-dependent deacetylase